MEKLELNQTDLKLVALLVKSFRTNYNSAKDKITSDVVVRKVRERGHSFSGAKFRALLGTIRSQNWTAPGFIVSDNTGYWYTEDIHEMHDFWKSQRGRVMEIMKNVHPLFKRFKINPQQLMLEFMEQLDQPAHIPDTAENAIQ